MAIFGRFWVKMVQNFISDEGKKYFLILTKILRSTVNFSPKRRNLEQKIIFRGKIDHGLEVTCIYGRTQNGRK